MPSIQDVADQINARLDQINTHTQNTAQNTSDIHNDLVQANTNLDQIENKLDQVDNTLVTGLSNISQGLFSILQVDLASLQMLDHHRKQNDTIICELKNGNELLCNIMRKLGAQLELSEASLVALTRMEGISERVHCCEAADYDRDLEVQRKIEECCPPDPVRPEECPEPCKEPKFSPPKPEGLDWKPLPERQREPEG